MFPDIADKEIDELHDLIEQQNIEADLTDEQTDKLNNRIKKLEEDLEKAHLEINRLRFQVGRLLTSLNLWASTPEYILDDWTGLEDSRCDQTNT